VRAGKDHREEPAIFVFELHECEELGERLGHRECIRSIDDEHRVTTVLADDGQAFVDLTHQRLSLGGRLLDTQLHRETPQQPVGIDSPAQHEHHAGLEDLLLELLVELAQDRALARADAAGDHHQTARLSHATVDPEQRIVLRRDIELIALDRVVTKGVVVESEVL
jgi:hypothetical protein